MTLFTKSFTFTFVSRQPYELFSINKVFDHNFTISPSGDALSINYSLPSIARLIAQWQSTNDLDEEKVSCCFSIVSDDIRENARQSRQHINNASPQSVSINKENFLSFFEMYTAPQLRILRTILRICTSELSAGPFSTPECDCLMFSDSDVNFLQGGLLQIQASSEKELYKRIDQEITWFKHLVSDTLKETFDQTAFQTYKNREERERARALRGVFLQIALGYNEIDLALTKIEDNFDGGDLSVFAQGITIAMFVSITTSWVLKNAIRALKTSLVKAGSLSLADEQEIITIIGKDLCARILNAVKLRVKLDWNAMPTFELIHKTIIPTTQLALVNFARSVFANLDWTVAELSSYESDPESCCTNCFSSSSRGT